MRRFPLRFKVCLIPDRYGQYTISSIYFDTKDYQLIRTSLEKPVYKEKFRLRSYGVPGPEDSVFLELKKKYRGVIYKRRAVLSLAEADQYLLHGKQPAEQTQILREIDWTVRRYSLQPKVLLAYGQESLLCRGATGPPGYPLITISDGEGRRWICPRRPGAAASGIRNGLDGDQDSRRYAAMAKPYAGGIRCISHILLQIWNLLQENTP